jgi:hypothetical protein
LTGVGGLIGLLLSLEGLYARFFGVFLLRSQADPLWIAVARTLSAGTPPDLSQAGWLPVVMGSTWFGALAALWLKHRWGRNAVLILAALSALHGGAFTALGVLAFALALTAPVRGWADTLAGS